MLRRLACLMLVGLVAATCSSLAQAQWKWRDKGGQIHLSDLPPPAEVPDKDVLQRPGAAAHKAGMQSAAPVPASAASVPGARPAIDPELEARMRRAEQDKQVQKKADDERVAAQRAENCKRARDQIRTLESGQRIARTNEKGEREFLDDQQKAQEAQRARDVITSDCR